MSSAVYSPSPSIFVVSIATLYGAAVTRSTQDMSQVDDAATVLLDCACATPVGSDAATASTPSLPRNSRRGGRAPSSVMTPSRGFCDSPRKLAWMRHGRQSVTVIG